MSAEGKNNIFELFRRWVSGDVRRAEEQQLEQLAADDPFVAEAMEGYRRFPEGDHARQVTKLKADLRKRYQKEDRKGVFYWYRIAAAVVLLIVAVGGFWWLNDGGMGESEMAVQDLQNEPGAQSEEPATGINDSTSDVEPQEQVESDINQSIADAEVGKEEETKPAPSNNFAKSRKRDDEQRIAQSKDTKPQVDALASKTKKEDTADRISMVEVEPLPTVAEEAAGLEPSAPDPLPPAIKEDPPVELEEDAFADELSEPAKRAKQRVTTPSQAMERAEPPRTIAGTVVDGLTGEPLIGVSILIPDTQNGTVTDFDGQFRLDVPEGTTELIFDYVGYTREQVNVKGETLVNVELETNDVALDEVVVTGYATEEKTSATQDPAFAQPEGGKKALREYIDDNLVYPQEALANGIEGKVRLRFKVYPNGRLGQFKVLKSLGYGCDQEAIRLLENGPRWEVTGTNEALIRKYTVKFKLP